LDFTSEAGSFAHDISAQNVAIEEAISRLVNDVQIQQVLKIRLLAFSALYSHHGSSAALTLMTPSGLPSSLTVHQDFATLPGVRFERISFGVAIEYLFIG
jgi:hypothetical protein